LKKLAALVICGISLGGVTILVAACATCSGARMSYGVGVGYSGYYGRGPYYHYPGRPIIIDGVRPEFPEPPVATPLPSFGMPEPMMGTMDLGGFDF
jgi:hypothetical protein